MKTYAILEYKDILNYDIIGATERLEEARQICRDILLNECYESIDRLSDGLFYHVFGHDSNGDYRSFWIAMEE